MLALGTLAVMSIGTLIYSNIFLKKSETKQTTNARALTSELCPEGIAVGDSCAPSYANNEWCIACTGNKDIGLAYQCIYNEWSVGTWALPNKYGEHNPACSQSLEPTESATGESPTPTIKVNTAPYIRSGVVAPKDPGWQCPGGGCSHCGTTLEDSQQTFWTSECDNFCSKSHDAPCIKCENGKPYYVSPEGTKEITGEAFGVGTSRSTLPNCKKTNQYDAAAQGSGSSQGGKQSQTTNDAQLQNNLKDENGNNQGTDKQVNNIVPGADNNLQPTPTHAVNPPCLERTTKSFCGSVLNDATGVTDNCVWVGLRADGSQCNHCFPVSSTLGDTISASQQEVNRVCPPSAKTNFDCSNINAQNYGDSTPCITAQKNGYGCAWYAQCNKCAKEGSDPTKVCGDHQNFTSKITVSVIVNLINCPSSYVIHSLGYTVRDFGRKTDVDSATRIYDIKGTYGRIDFPVTLDVYSDYTQYVFSGNVAVANGEALLYQNSQEIIQRANALDNVSLGIDYQCK